MARFYSNENFPRRAVEALREIGHDVLTSYEAGRANQQIHDADVLAYATEQQRILLTVNRKIFIESTAMGS
jgi:predicted nuclease of predicted toxin-antitoxin system